MIISASQCHVRQMSAAGLREADRLEVQASAGLDPATALRDSFNASSKSWVLLDEGVACGMWGVTPSVDHIFGVPWLLASPRFDLLHNQKQLLRHTKHYVREMEDGFAFLFNFTDVRHTSSHRWLRWAGFKFGNAAPHGHEQRFFYPFLKEPSHV